VGGIPEGNILDLLKERWGIANVFKDKEPQMPIKEGRYWPAYHDDW